MKKGFELYRMIILSASALTLTAIITTTACNKSSSGTEPAVNNSAATYEPDNSQDDNNNAQDMADTATTPADTTTAPADTTTAPADTTMAPAGGEEEPVLSEATPEPDMDPDTWDYISGGDYNMVYTDESVPDKMPYEIRINKQMNCVTIYKPDKKGMYTKPYKSMVCSAGRDTPLGTFKTSDKYYWKAMIHGVWAQYATRITGSILFHSVPYDTHEKNTLISRYYNQLGQTASAGCVRLSVRDAKWIIENCPAGTNVTIYNDSNAGPLGKPSPVRVPSDCRWDPTDPDNRNPWSSDISVISGVKDRTVERGYGVNYLQGIIAYDVHAGTMSSNNIKIKTRLNPSKPGKYKVTYSFKDSKKNTVKESCVFTVTDTKPPVISGLPETMYTKNISEINKDYVYKHIKLTDNGYALSKDDHMTISKSGKDNRYIITAHDDYGHTSTFTFNAVEDKEAPVLTLKGGLKELYPVTQKIDKKWAENRIKKVSDNIAKLGKSDVQIAVKPSGWGMKINYSVKDTAGNTTTLSEKVSFETASISLTSDSIVVKNVDNDKSISKYVKLTSDTTGKKVPCKLKIKSKETGSDEQYTQYKVTITATYTSSAGKKTASVTTIVNETL